MRHFTCCGLWSKERGMTVPFMSHRMPRESPTLATVKCPRAVSSRATKAVEPVFLLLLFYNLIAINVEPMLWSSLPATSLSFLASVISALSDSMMAILSSVPRSNSSATDMDIRLSLMDPGELLMLGFRPELMLGRRLLGSPDSGPTQPQ